jgi:membrane-bound ClpP family serine protease
MKNKKYTVYSVVTTLLEEVALVAVVLWLLPRFEISIPLWGLILMMVALGAYAYISYRLGKEALDKKPMMSSEAMVGTKCITTTPLAPKGYVRVGSELWQALSIGSNVGKDAEVVIARMEGLTLFVTPLDNSNHEADEADALSN